MSVKEVPFQTVGADPLSTTQTIRLSLRDIGLSENRMAFLAKLPFFLNSSLKLQRVVSIALEHISEELGAEASVLYVLSKSAPDSPSSEFTYWAMCGEDKRREEGISSFESNPSIQSVVVNRYPVLLNKNSAGDLSHTVPTSLGIVAQNQVAMPLLVRGSECVGVLQIVNIAKSTGEDFNTEDIAFLEQFCFQVALAIDNAALLQEAQRQSAQLQELDRRKSEVISVIAHEFRTPLNIIKTASDLLSKGNCAEDQAKEMLQLLKGGVDRLSRLISQVRNVSLVQDQDIALKQQPTDLNSLCQEAVSKFINPATERSIKLRFKPAEGAAIVSADSALLAIVIYNLLANAIRFTPDGGSILVHVATNDSAVRVSVVDNGIGISQEQQALIFEKFYEVTNLLNHSSGDFQFKSSGLGLGLAAVRHILDAHSTSVELKSQEGKGSSFSFTLPRYIP